MTTCLVNSDRLPSPKMPQTVSLSPQTGTTGSDFSSPDQVKSFQASPLVRGVLERSQEGIDRLERSGKGTGLVGWATKSFRRMSTPKSANRKKLPIPDSPTSPHFSPYGLKRCQIICLFVVCMFVYQSIAQSKLRMEQQNSQKQNELLSPSGGSGPRFAASPVRLSL